MFPSLRKIMLDSIEQFNENRITAKSKSGPINKINLENKLAIPKYYFTRQEKWYIFPKWFVQLKNEPIELEKLKKTSRKGV